MATIPDERQLGRRPAPNAPSGLARYQAGGDIEAPGRAVDALTQRIGGAVDRAFVAQEAEIDRVATLRAEESYQHAVAARIGLTHDPKEGFTAVRGSAVLSRNLVDEYTKKYADVGDKLAEGLGTPLQRGKFRARFAVSQSQLLDDVSRHNASQGLVAQEQIYESGMVMQTQAASVAWESPNDVAIALGAINNAIDERGENAGWKDEQIEAEKLVRTSGVHQSVILQAIANGKNAYAEDWFKRYEKQIDPSTANTLAVAVANGEQKDRFNDLSRVFILSKDRPTEARRQILNVLQDEILTDDLLNDDRKNTLLNQVGSALEQMRRRDEAEYGRKLSAVGRALDRMSDTIKDGFPVSPEQAQQALDAAAGTELEGQAKRIVQLSDATAYFMELHPAQQAQAMQQYERALRESPDQGDIGILNAWKSIADATKKALQDDPGAWAVSKNLFNPVPIDLATPETQQAEFTELFDRAQTLRDRYGAAYKPLEQSQVDVMTQVLDNADWQTQSDYFGRLFQGAGGDIRGFTGIMSQIAPNRPVAAMAGEYWARGQKDTAKLMLRGQSILKPKAENGKPAGGSLLPMPPSNEMQTLFSEYVGDAYAGRPAARSAAEQSARAIYAALAADEGSTSPEVISDDIWLRALGLATGGVAGPDGEVDGGVIEHGGGRVTLPIGMDRQAFKDRLDRHMDIVAKTPGVDPALDKATLTDLPLVPGPRDGTYAIRDGNKLLMRTDPDDARRGELGMLTGEDGRNMTEYSITVEVDGKWVNIPTFVKGQEDVDRLLAGEGVTEKQQQIAIARAQERVASGATLPTYETMNAALNAAKNRLESEKMIQGGESLVPIVIDLSEVPDGPRVSSGKIGGVELFAYDNPDTLTRIPAPRALPPLAGQESPAREPAQAVEPAPATAPAPARQAAPAPKPGPKPQAPTPGNGLPTEESGTPVQSIDASPVPATPAEVKQHKLPKGSKVLTITPDERIWDKVIADEWIAGNKVLKIAGKHYVMPVGTTHADEKARVFPEYKNLDPDTVLKLIKYLNRDIKKR